MFKRLALSAMVVLGLWVGQGRAGEPATGPSLGTGLSGIADWSTEQPFLDLMKAARPWVASTPAQWGAWDYGALVAGGYLSPEGWPRELPPGAQRFESIVLADQPEAAGSLAGTYVLRWEGDAEVGIYGRAERTAGRGQELRFSYRPGGGHVVITVAGLDPARPLRSMTLVREDLLPLHEGGATFNPDFLARVREFRALRFMDWMMTNGSAQVTWEDRPRPDDATWMTKGVPVEIMVRLANEVGADPWFNMPHRADDAYVAAFAGYVRDHLDPRLKAYVEWSNEVWNFIFPQANWAREQALARWGEGAGGDAWMQFAGLRAAEVADGWAAAFGEASGERLVRVVGVQTGWLGLELPLLDAPLAVAEGRQPPFESFDAYAVTGYFGHGIGAEEMAPRLRGWIERGIAVEEVTALARADLEDLTGTLWPYHARVARERDLQLVAYEGGTHIVGNGPAMQEEAITGFLTGYSYSSEMASLYDDLLAGWNELGGTLFMHYLDVASPSRFGSWGALRHLDDSNPRWDALMRANAVPARWEEREPGTFDHGVQLVGSEVDETLTGTAEEDDLVGLGGDDVLVSQGGSDRLNGGEGQDRAHLPGAASDWTGEVADDVTLLVNGAVTVRLTSVEEVIFGETESAPDASELR